MTTEVEMTDVEFVAALAETTAAALATQKAEYAKEIGAVLELIEKQDVEIRSLREELSAAIVRPLEEVIREEMARVEFHATPGKDGRGIEAATIGEGMLTLRYTDSTEQIVGRVMGEPGSPGKDAILDMEALEKSVESAVSKAVDAIDVSELRGEPGEPGKDAEPIDRVTLAKDVLALIPVPRDGQDGIASRDELRAEVAKAVEATVAPTVQKAVAESIAALPTLQYRGVFREGTTYKAGECVTWAGSMWHADSETEEKPGEGKTSWTLMVKKGRDAT